MGVQGKLDKEMPRQGPMPCAGTRAPPLFAEFLGLFSLIKDSEGAFKAVMRLASVTVLALKLCFVRVLAVECASGLKRRSSPEEEERLQFLPHTVVSEDLPGPLLLLHTGRPAGLDGASRASGTAER
ncbi:hypothetical protein P7K49_030694 [Saguinus oedipus]|uniref:Uncharacterized protein n=1 Tax=Saguinus oedipus TaxID=9490 RepID=A0ABQ9U3Q9_SAGOE|nr:hypothetical protein P7K49_030694 [Saguinus oedipus]